MLLEEQLDLFIKNWGGIKVNRHEGRLVYKVVPTYASRSAARANELIEELSLDLIAIPNDRYPQDSFIIQKK